MSEIAVNHSGAAGGSKDSYPGMGAGRGGAIQERVLMNLVYVVT